MSIPNHQMDEQDMGSTEALTDKERDEILEFIFDVFSIDVITAKGDITLKLTTDKSIFGEATGNDPTIKILARTIIQFGGDQLVIIPTTNDGNVLSIDPQIWEIHKENVNSAILNRKNTLKFFTDLINIIISQFPKLGNDKKIARDLLLSITKKRSEETPKPPT
jgi:hypothetical protein